MASRSLTALAKDAPAALAAIDTVRAAARARVWALAGQDAPDHDTNAASPLVVENDKPIWPHCDGLDSSERRNTDVVECHGAGRSGPGASAVAGVHTVV